MDWSKIKNVLIIALILTDLMFIYFLAAPDVSSGGSADPQRMENTLKILEANGITVSADIPSKSEMPAITLSYAEDNGVYYYTPAEIVLASELTAEAAKEKADSFLGSLGLYDSSDDTLRHISTVPVEEQEYDYIVSYGYYFNGYRIENCYINCYVAPEGVIEMDRIYADAEISSTGDLDILPVTTALLKYMNQVKTEDPSAVKDITDVSLVYMVDAPYSGDIASDTAFPSWKFTASDNTSICFSAYD